MQGKDGQAGGEFQPVERNLLSESPSSSDRPAEAVARDDLLALRASRFCPTEHGGPSWSFVRLWFRGSTHFLPPPELANRVVMCPELPSKQGLGVLGFRRFGLCAIARSAF